jgi:hypothetical protein
MSFVWPGGCISIQNSAAYSLAGQGSRAVAVLFISCQEALKMHALPDQCLQRNTRGLSIS